MQVCGWRRSGRLGYWPGRGPFSFLPPWERPGWLYGPWACWWFHTQRPYRGEATVKEDLEYLKSYAEELKLALEEVESKIKSLESRAKGNMP